MSRKKYNIQQQIDAIKARDGYQCRYEDDNGRCNVRGINNLQAAHGIGKGKFNRKHIWQLCWYLFWREFSEYEIDLIMHHQWNLWASCSIHNDYFNIGHNKMQSIRLFCLIIADLIDRGEL